MYPIVLVHGIARFDIVAETVRKWNIPWLKDLERFQYFKGIASHLARNGFPGVLSPNLDFAAASQKRAQTLKTDIGDFLTKTGAEKVHLIAHSMGGLDARRMIVDLQMADKVASLTTIGTPHWGTPFADFAGEHGVDELVRNAMKFLKLDLTGHFDLKVDECRKFNKRVADDEAKNSVHYQTYSSEETGNRIFGLLIPSYIYIRDHGPDGKPVPNDGLVPVESQKWASEIEASDGTRKPVRQEEFPFPADHLNECGWWDWEERDGIFDTANPTKQKREYEDKVKAVYLKIAQDVQQYL